jgi:hypothetical protein
MVTRLYLVFQVFVASYLKQQAFCYNIGRYLVTIKLRAIFNLHFVEREQNG